MFEIETDITSSILALNKDSLVSVKADDVDQITWHCNNPKNITKAQILAKQIELKEGWGVQQYARNRKAEYPPMEDQLDYIFHNGVDKWKEDIIQPVKDKYPKS
jgi:hypothetical protein